MINPAQVACSNWWAIGWLNGWLVILLLGLTEGVLFLAFPKAVVKRLFDRSGWSQKQRIFTIAGKLCALVCLALLTLAPLKLGQPVFVIGSLLIALSLVGLVKAMFDFRYTPLDEPVTRGIYRLSRHPQVVTSSLVILGARIAVGVFQLAPYVWSMVYSQTKDFQLFRCSSLSQVTCSYKWISAATRR